MNVPRVLHHRFSKIFKFISSPKSAAPIATAIAHRRRSSSTYVKRNLTFDYDSHSDNTTNFDIAPIIICHGLFCNKKQWVATCKELNQLTGRKVIAYDAVNHGSGSHHKSMSYHDMALDLVTFIESELNINKGIVCLGHRMGGKTAMTVALAQPEKFAKLVVIDSAPCPRRESLLGDTTLVLKAVLSIDLSVYTTREEIVERVNKIDMVPLLRESILESLIETRNKGFRWVGNLQGVIDNYNELISFPSFNEDVSFPAPTLFVGDNHKHAHEVPAIMRRFPSAELFQMDDCDFNLHRRMPEDVVECVGEFLK